LELFLDLRAQQRPFLEAGPKNPGRAEKGVPSPNIKNLKIKWGFLNFLQKTYGYYYHYYLANWATLIGLSQNIQMLLMFPNSFYYQ
jgi:hypothetical protein